MLHVEDGMEVKALEVWAELRAAQTQTQTLAVRHGSYQLVEVNGDRATMK